MTKRHVRKLILPLFFTLSGGELLLACSNGGGSDSGGEASASGGGSGTGSVSGSGGSEGPTPFVPAACRDGNEFSTPELRAPRCAKQKRISTGFNGNGHSESWDGRLFFVTKNTNEAPHSVGWVIRVLRPEKITSDGDGAPDFSKGAFSDETILEVDTPEKSHNAHAVVADPAFPENPYRSDEAGTASPGGAFETYGLLFYAQNYEQNSRLEARKLRVVVENPKTENAQVKNATFLDAFQAIETKSNKPVHAIEPTLTVDGRLLIMQGHPDNDGKIDYLVYSVNDRPGSLTGWSEPKYITSLYSDRDTMLGNLTLGQRFPIAESPLKDSLGVAYADGEPFHGAYPWISHDGTELFFMATVAGDNDARPGERARRGGASVIGRFTNFGTRHLDGPINPSRDGMTPSSTVRLFFSSPGAFSTMWRPFRDVPNLALPYAKSGPMYPLFGSNTGDYNEVHFEDFLDKTHVVSLPMNESLAHDSVIDATKTADISGHFNTGIVTNAKFPIEYSGADEIVGETGQALYFPESGKVTVTKSASFDALDSSFSVDFWVKRSVDMNQDGENRFLYLANLPGVFQIILEETGAIQSRVTVAGSEKSSGPLGSVTLGSWAHVAVSYDATSGDFSTYIDGSLTGTTNVGKGVLGAATGDLVIGPGSQTPDAPFVDNAAAVVLLDDLHLRSVALRADELAVASHSCAPNASSWQTPSDLPLGLVASEFRIPSNARTDADAIALGEKLFFDTALSGDGTMSCATCHVESLAFSDGKTTALSREKFLSRNTQSLLNRAMGTTQFWDGRSASLEAQALVPIENPEEMNQSLDDLGAKLAADASYAGEFEKVFGAAPSPENIALALAAFERTLLSGNSAVDRYEAGDAAALSDSAKRGRELFRGKARCVACHSGSNYSDEEFHNNGASCVGDEGRFAITLRNRDLGSMRTPSLRDVARTAPYLHDGSLATLAEVIDSYDKGGLHALGRDAEIRPLGLTSEEKNDLVEFLKALDGAK